MNVAVCARTPGHAGNSFADVGREGYCIDLKLFVMGVLLSCIVFFNKRGGLQKTSPSTTLIRRRWAPVIKEREIEGGSQM